MSAAAAVTPLHERYDILQAEPPASGGAEAWARHAAFLTWAMAANQDYDGELIEHLDEQIAALRRSRTRRVLAALAAGSFTTWLAARAVAGRR